VRWDVRDVDGPVIGNGLRKASVAIGAEGRGRTRLTPAETLRSVHAMRPAPRSGACPSVSHETLIVACGKIAQTILLMAASISKGLIVVKLHHQG
jgi:hypothetical protein